MLKIFLMPDAEKFLSLIRRCRGDVLLQLPDGSQCSLKHNDTAQQLVRITRPGRDGISIRFSDSGDIPTFLRYFAGAMC